MKTLSRRLLLKLSVLTGLSFLPVFRIVRAAYRRNTNGDCGTVSPLPLGVENDGYSHIYYSKNGSPENNLSQVIEMMGGIQSLIGLDDIIILKPNSQWWNQGMTNTNTMKEFISLVLDIPKFTGEIIIADNHQYQDDNSRGWSTDSPNGDYNLNQLVEYFQANGFKNVTKCHWHCAGPNKGLVQGDANGNSVVEGPQQGEGYVWRKDLIYRASSGRKTMMNYPIFKSRYSGIIIDFKNGPYKDGEYLNRELKFINFPSLNHHSTWGGMTSCIKNYLGIVDMSCGYHGSTPKGFFNFHYVGHSDLNVNYPRIRKFKKKFGFGYMDHFHGGPVGFFMKNIRMADLNIVTGDWVGYGSRTDTKLSARPKVVMASKDPVALDYFSSKRILLPATPKDVKYSWGPMIAPYNDPDNINGPLRMYLNECHQEGIGNLTQDKVKIHTADLQHA